MARRDHRAALAGLALAALAALVGSAAATEFTNFAGNVVVKPTIDQPNGAILNFEHLEFNRQPSNPVFGTKMTVQFHVTNLGNEPSLKGEIAVWANSTQKGTCNPTNADATVKFPAIKPFGSKLVQATVTVPSLPGDYTLQIFYDSTCANNILSPHASQLYAVNGSPDPDYGLYNVYPSGTDSSQTNTVPYQPVVNQTFEVILTIKNYGSGSYENSSPVLKVSPGIWFGSSAPTGEPPAQPANPSTLKVVTVEIPKLKPGKSFDAKAMLTVPAAGVWKLDAILEVNGVQFKSFDTFYKVTYRPQPYFVGIYKPNTFGQKVATSPAKTQTGPDAKPYKVKVSFQNVGTAPGKIGALAYYQGNTLDFLFPVIKDDCMTDTAVAVGNFTDVELAPGKKKTFTIQGAPALNKTGWFLATVIPDALCETSIRPGLAAQQAFATKGAP
ncbi:hypothetical protein Rsub_02908 [Raphidocelis subcapitata]|uniref:Uncharacterized protein n=1 Tax=Raphidocelis subcapitata TaxID=307507 RepID=A0A2V0NQ17_9CHLO|nr:hypothetical protein Rsub_02908 [Raphidocelis subcapitata]|eukprot:GBF89738.1 hypothetical protein Rsub_02908 [Raphidocelis subcapitata]